MFIREIKLENFKSFKGEHTLFFEKNFTFFVGDNNSGKSTIFESVDFLKAGISSTKKLEDIKTKDSMGDVSVTVKLQGGLKSVVDDFSESKYLDYIFDEDGIETILAKRTSRISKIFQGKKEVEINVKKVTLWNDKTKQFENPSGLDTVFKTLFETQFIWADTNPDDISDFGSTKICGRLLAGSIGNFFETKQWNDFVDVHAKTFSNGPDSLSVRTKDLERKIQDIIASQYGIANVNFNFQLPEATSFIKAGTIDIDDGTKTSSKDKGTGMQRALALALIQIYADELCKHPDDPTKKKPLFLFIDEPETFLHPKAQDKLLRALDAISDIQQVFVTTHSPYLLKSFNSKKHILYSCQRSSGTNKVNPSNVLNLFGKSSPTWGEINYFAYGLETVEFHNELYGFVQTKAIRSDSKYEKIEELDKYLLSNGVAIYLDWIHEKTSGDIKYKVTLPTYIRNIIHHPENSKNITYSSTQLSESTKKLIDILKK
jgi:energy-coupling factor transporter ATP-binding protein EcfA2